MSIEKLQDRLLWEIVNEYNIRQVASLTFIKLSLKESTDNTYDGIVQCSESSKSWDIPLKVSLDGNTINWQLNELEWFKFKVVEESQDMDSLLAEAKVLEDKGDFNGARDKFQVIEMFARKYGQKKIVIYSLISQAWISLHKLNDLNAATEKYQEADKICKAVLDKKNIKLILHDQAYLSLKKGEQETALWKYGEYKRQSKNDKLFDKFTDEMFSDIVKKDDNAAPRLERPLLEYNELRVLDKKVTDTVSRCSILWAQAMSQSGEKKYDEAVASMDQYVGLNFEIGDRNKVMDGLFNLGVFMYEKGNFEKSLEMFQGQEKYCRALADKKELKRCLHNQASILRYKLEKFEDALIKYIEAEPLCIELEDVQSLMDNLQNQVWLHYEKAGDYESAYKKSQDLEKLSRREGKKEILEFCLKYQYDILKAWGERNRLKLLKRSLIPSKSRIYSGSSTTSVKPK